MSCSPVADAASRAKTLRAASAANATPHSGKLTGRVICGVGEDDRPAVLDVLHRRRGGEGWGRGVACTRRQPQSTQTRTARHAHTRHTPRGWRRCRPESRPSGRGTLRVESRGEAGRSTGRGRGDPTFCRGGRGRDATRHSARRCARSPRHSPDPRFPMEGILSVGGGMTGAGWWKENVRL